MGIKLVKQAVEFALPQLSTRAHASRTLLLVMCMRAKDSDERPVYHAGAPDLARRLGHDFESEAGKKAVQRAMEDLVQAGFVQQLEGLPRHWKRRWLITLPTLGDRTLMSPRERTPVSPPDRTPVSP